MTDQTIVVPKNAGLIDGIQSVARYLIVIVGFVTAFLALLKVHDIAGMITLVQSNGGQVLGAISGLIALGTAAYGVFKTSKRGSQVASVATNPDVDDSIATTK
jgi:predicted enzyme related to lactoylglutathione lyase